jgi:hypothetical protein
MLICVDAPLLSVSEIEKRLDFAEFFYKNYPLIEKVTTFNFRSSHSLIIIHSITEIFLSDFIHSDSNETSQLLRY